MISPTRLASVRSLAAVAVLLSTLGSAPDAGASTAVPAPESGTFTVDVGTVESGTMSTRSTCVFFMEGDYVHISSSAPRTASAHGWWRNARGCSGLKAVVKTRLQRQNANGTWTDIGSLGRATVYSGGGAGKRTVTRHVCAGTATKTYRHWVDVDVIGVADAPNKHYSPARRLQCG